MTTQSVKTQSTNLFGSSTTSTSTKGKQAGKGFDLLISNNMKANQNIFTGTEASTVKKTSYKKTEDTSKSGEAEKNAKVTEYGQAKVVSTDKDKAVKQSDDVKAVGTQTTDNIRESKVDTEDVTEYEKLMAGINNMLQSIQQAVMQTLNLSAEEFSQLMEEQGMSISDLLQSENLQQLLLANNGGTDILTVLTDENLAKQMDELLQKVEGIITDAKLGFTKDQIEIMITQAKLNANNMAQTDFIQSIDPETLTDQTSNKAELIKAFAGSVNEDEKSVTMEGTKDNLILTTQSEGTKESYSSTQGDASNQENSELSAEDQFQTFIDNLVNSTGQTKFDMTGNMVQVTELREIANQIIERIKVSITPDQTSMELQLNPENLGKVNLTIQSKNGLMTAQFVVQNEVTKEAIESQMHILRESLNEQGIKVEAIEVTVANYAFDQNSQDDTGNQTPSKENNSSKKITLEEALNMTEISEESIDSEDATGILGSQVDYTA